MASSIEKISIALPPEMVASLRQVWKTAREKNGPYVPAGEVMDRLERKYQVIADAVGATDGMEPQDPNTRMSECES
jgi:hypothetical protein